MPSLHPWTLDAGTLCVYVRAGGSCRGNRQGIPEKRRAECRVSSEMAGTERGEWVVRNKRSCAGAGLLEEQQTGLIAAVDSCSFQEMWYGSLQVHRQVKSSECEPLPPPAHN